MSDGNSNNPVSMQFPERPIERIVEPIAAFFRIEALGGIVLLGAAIAALAIANSPFAEIYNAFWNQTAAIQFGPLSLALPLRDVVNEGLMTLFFFLVGLEVKREIVLGELKTFRLAALPIAAAIGGMVVPAGLYLSLQSGAPGADAWGVVMASDIAFVIGCLALLGSRVPHSLRIFVLSFAIIDDLGAILVIAAGYTAEFHPFALLYAAAGLGVVVLMRQLGVRSLGVFFAGGFLVWLAVHESGIHATITGVVLGLLTPVEAWLGPDRLRSVMHTARERVRGHGRHANPSEERQERALLRSVAFAARETVSPLERLESDLHPWVSYLIMPLFAFANAGVPLSFGALGDPIVVAIAAGLVAGKPIGIFGASWVAVRLGLAARPRDLGWGIIAAAGALAGIGFTMAIFIANLAFAEALLDTAKAGILAASLISAVFGLAFLAAALRRGGRQD